MTLEVKLLARPSPSPNISDYFHKPRMSGFDDVRPLFMLPRQRRDQMNLDFRKVPFTPQIVDGLERKVRMLKSNIRKQSSEMGEAACVRFQERLQGGLNVGCLEDVLE